MPTAIFHVIRSGQAWARPRGGQAQPLNAGDVAVFVRGTSHIMSDRPAGRAERIEDLPSHIGEDGFPIVTIEGEGASTSILCGTLSFDSVVAEHIVAHLPDLIVARSRPAVPTFIDGAVALLIAEADGQLMGREVVSDRIAEIIFVIALRSAFATEATGWLAALDDPGLSRCLAAMHNAPEENWTAARLAKVAGMSRSLIFTRFAERVGETPQQYLRGLRILLARQALRQSEASVAEVGRRYGYASEAAFSRVFKRVVGSSPSAYRRAQSPDA